MFGVTPNRKEPLESRVLNDRQWHYNIPQLMAIKFSCCEDIYLANLESLPHL